MDVMTKLMLSAFTKEEVLSWPLWRSAQVKGDYSTLEHLLEDGGVTSSQLEMTKLQLDYPDLAQSVMQPLLQQGHLHLLRMALQHRPELAIGTVDDASSTPLHVASRHGQPAAVRMLLNAGADLEAVTESDGWTALHEAVACGGGGGPVVAGVLLRAGAQVDHKDKMGRTPLQLAAEQGRSRIVIMLVAVGVDVNIRDKDGNAPVHWAAQHCDEEAVRALLVAGADRYCVDKYKATPLHYAARGGSSSVVRLLLDGAEVDAKNGDGCTPLHWAAYSDNVEAARELLAAGADATSRGRYGTPLHEAAEKDRVNMVRLLLETTDVNVTDHDGRTPLHRAALWGRLAVARVLLEAGADKTVRDKHGKTAFSWCLRMGELKVLLR